MAISGYHQMIWIPAGSEVKCLVNKSIKLPGQAWPGIHCTLYRENALYSIDEGLQLSLYRREQLGFGRIKFECRLVKIHYLSAQTGMTSFWITPGRNRVVTNLYYTSNAGMCFCSHVLLFNSVAKFLW